MNLFQISGKNLLKRPLNSMLSLLLIVLGVSIVSLLAVLGRQLRSQFRSNIEGIDLVVGAEGSPLQLVLSSCFHIDNPTGNIPLAEARRFMEHPMVETAIPLSMGDSYRGFRIVGSEPSLHRHYGAELATGHLWDAPLEATLGKQVAAQTGLTVGDTFYSTHGMAKEGYRHTDHGLVVTGVWKATGSVLDQLIVTQTESIWRLHEHGEGSHGAKDHPAHNKDEHEHGHKHEDEADEHHDHSSEKRAEPHKAAPPEQGRNSEPGHRAHDRHAYREELDSGRDTEQNASSGTQTPPEAPDVRKPPQAQDSGVSSSGARLPSQDSASAAPMLGMPMTESGSSTPRQKDGGGEASEEGRAITAVLIKVRNQLAKLQLPRQINEVANLQAAVPAFEIRRLQKLLGFGTATLQTLGLAIMIVAGLSVFIALFNNLKDRRYEMALMRSMGLPPARLFLMVLLEGLFIGLGGYALGLLLSRLEWLVVRSVVQDAFRYQLETPWMTPTEGWLLVATLFISLLAALIPALRVMRMDISKVLAEA